MATEFFESVSPDDDAEGRVLEALADGDPYVFIVTTIDGDDINLRVAVGAGVAQVSTLRAILSKTLASLPDAS